jgi:hypothetical protein
VPVCILWLMTVFIQVFSSRWRGWRGAYFIENHMRGRQQPWSSYLMLFCCSKFSIFRRCSGPWTRTLYGTPAPRLFPSFGSGQSSYRLIKESNQCLCSFCADDSRYLAMESKRHPSSRVPVTCPQATVDEKSLNNNIRGSKKEV